VLYDIPDLSDGNVSAGYITIVEQNLVDLVSSSFGGCEKFDGPAYNNGHSLYGILAAEHEVFLQGNSQGITFLASSGDSAGKGCPDPAYFTGGPSVFKAGVETPAADTAVTAVGGTNVISGSSLNSLTSPYSAETGWSDPEIPYDPYGVGVNVSGGYWGAGSGYSAYFKKPSYQLKVTTGSDTARAVPDIGMQVGGCPGGISILDPIDNRCDGAGMKRDGYPDYRRSYVIVSLDGAFYGLIGTSVASPELAGALALLIETQGRQGNINPYLYGLAAQQAAGQGTYFHTNIPGFNGIKQTELNSAYGLTAGVGTPYVAAIVGQPSAPLAGIPQTPSNP
jgi:subtilase family serine protease